MYELGCFLSQGYDGAVQEGQSVSCSQHPQSQTHWQEAGELPQGMYCVTYLNMSRQPQMHRLLLFALPVKLNETTSHFDFGVFAF